jgi:hypothetical protein
VDKYFDVVEYVHTYQTCQLTKAEHGRQCVLLHPLPLPSLRFDGCMIGVDWIARLQMTEGWFNMIQNHVDLLLGRVHTHSPHWRYGNAAEAAEIIHNMCLRSGNGFPDVLVVDHYAKCTS